jgi:hypothetical protein
MLEKEKAMLEKENADALKRGNALKEGSTLRSTLFIALHQVQFDFGLDFNDAYWELHEK